MRNPMSSCDSLLLSLILLLLGVGARAQGSDSDLAFFENKIRPLLVEHCYKCHSEKSEKVKGELLLDSREAMLAGGESKTSPTLVPGNPAKSLLITAVSYSDPDLEMPPKNRLSAQQVADLTTWVAAGAQWPVEKISKKPSTTDTPKAPKLEAFDLKKRKAAHWAWQPIKDVPPPAASDMTWANGPIDRFILARLDKEGLKPAAATDKRTLIRRLYFDLIGLPPAPEDVEAFVNDASSTALESRVDALLTSPRFGERWGRHWLDLVRYAETRGHEFEPVIPNAWQYRDYVIRAFNADVPYNLFVQEHLAGDLLPQPRLNPTTGANESILGTGFWFLNEQVHSPVDIRQDEADRFDNMIDVTGKTFLGLTVACARCHDHKFDAISTKDYYAMAGFLQSSHYGQVRFETMEQERALATQLWAARREHAPRVAKALAESFQPTAKKIDSYLLGAREALSKTPSTAEQIATVAKKRQLDDGILGKWIEYFRLAADQPNDLLNAWARLSTATKNNPQLALPAATEWLRAATKPTPALVGEVVIDYSRKDEPWFPDSVSFGPGPLQIGELRLGAGSGSFAMDVQNLAAATYDPFWSVLKRTADSARDPNGLDYDRTGNTLRTRTFALTTGKLFVLMRGSCRLYAAVDSHTIIAGPLHAQLLEKFDSKNVYTWQSMNLSAYPGHRAHLEFSAESPNFSIAKVIQGEQSPAPVETGSGQLARQLAGDGATPEALAKGYKRLIELAMNRLAANALAGQTGSEGLALVADWLVKHPELFGSGEAPAVMAKDYLDEQAKISAKIRPESHLAMAMFDGSGEDDFVMVRGSWKKPGELAPRQLLEAIGGKQAPITQGSGRLELARRIVDTSNPFTARVMVNRIWHHLFGKGIVASVDNFGLLGEKPTHPELLDALASDFIRQGWSVKKIIRTMVLTSTYRMSSQVTDAADNKDPNNLLLHRMNVRRLEGEIIRDAILSVSGRLDVTAGGPGIATHLTDFMQGRGRPGSGPLDGNGRRSVYLTTWRNFLSPMMMAFDAPTPFNTMGRRSVSNVPAQALILMNDPFVIEQAKLWANRALSGSHNTAEQRISRMYQSAFARPPSEAEAAAVLAFLAGHDQDQHTWADLAHVLINSKEFIYIN